MDRRTVYYGALPRDLDILQPGQFAMTGLAKLAEAVLGTAAAVDGFTLVPTGPATLSLTLGAGQIYQQANLEASTWGSLPADTHTIMKQGIALDPQNLTFVTPTTTGYAQNVLVEVQYQDADTGTLVLPYYNPANPSTPFSGPANSGASQSTIRSGAVAVQLKYGTAATSGTQVTPTPDAGWAPLYVVTLAQGQTQITAGSIAKYPTAPFIAGKLTSIPAFVFSGQVQQTATSPVLYVRTDGNDTNDGSANTSGKAFATIAAAIAKGVSGFALSNTTLTIQLGNAGTYAAPLSYPAAAVSILIQGDQAAQSSYIISGSGPVAGSSGVLAVSIANVAFNGVTLQNTGTTNHTINTNSAGVVTLTYTTVAVTVGSNPFNHILSGSGGLVVIGAGCIFSGSMNGLINAIGGSITIKPVTVTISGTPSYFISVFGASVCGTINIATGAGFSGNALGTRYAVSLNGVINTFGAGATFLPGNSAGTTSTGGQYG